MSKSYVDIQRMQQSQVSNGERNAIRDSTEDIAGRKAQDLTKNQLHTRQKDDRFEARPGPSKNDHFISTPPLTRTTILPSNVVREEIIPGSGLCYIYDDGTVLRKSDDGELRNPSGSKPRKRVGQACNSCRERRIGCDQRKPKCLRCEYSGRQCIYETTFRTRPATSRKDEDVGSKVNRSGASRVIDGIAQTQDAFKQEQAAQRFYDQTDSFPVRPYYLADHRLMSNMFNDKIRQIELGPSFQAASNSVSKPLTPIYPGTSEQELRPSDKTSWDNLKESFDLELRTFLEEHQFRNESNGQYLTPEMIFESFRLWLHSLDDTAALTAFWPEEPKKEIDSKQDKINNDPIHDYDLQGSPPKRRVTRACDKCRRNKIKCDGRQPCTHCSVYSYECTYDRASNRRRIVAPAYIEALEQRLQKAESVIRAFLPGFDLDDPKSNTPPGKQLFETSRVNATTSGKSDKGSETWSESDPSDTNWSPTSPTFVIPAVSTRNLSEAKTRTVDVEQKSAPRKRHQVEVFKMTAAAAFAEERQNRSKSTPPPSSPSSEANDNPARRALNALMGVGSKSPTKVSEPNSTSSDLATTVSEKLLAKPSPVQSDGTYMESSGEESFIFAEDCFPPFGAEIETIVVEIADELARDFLSDARGTRTCTTGTWRQPSTESSTAQCSQRAAGSSTTPTSVTKRSLQKGQLQDDEDEEDARRRKRARLGNPEPNDMGSVDFFACPYAKYDPIRYSEANQTLSEKTYRRCRTACLTNISRLKQHLYRVHRRPEYYCLSCYLEFETERQWQEHAQMRPSCTLKTCPFDEKMTSDQVKVIKRRRIHEPPADAWVGIFRTLFPDVEVPANPYVELTDPSTAVPSVQDYTAFLEHNMPHRFAERLSRRLFGDDDDNDLWNPMTYQWMVNMALEETLPAVLQALHNEYQELRPAAEGGSEESG